MVVKRIGLAVYYRLRRGLFSLSPRLGEWTYLLWNCVRFATRAMLLSFRSKSYAVSRYRTPDSVRTEYDKSRQARQLTGWDSYVYGESHTRLSLNEDKIGFFDTRELIRDHRSHIGSVVSEACKSLANPTVCEVGSGDGSNLLLLKKEHPHIRAIGLELSPVSVELAQAAAEHFDLDVEFYQEDMTTAELTGAYHADVCFSSHALEQVPRGFEQAVDHMLGMASQSVIFFEPIQELWPHNLRGFVSRQRLSSVDFIGGLYGYLKMKGVHITTAERLGRGTTPLNETVHCQVARYVETD